ncbi:MAG: DNA polymerase [Ectothiorhodospiraceae bacterium]
MLDQLPFRELWCVDFEFHQGGTPGNRQVPVCMVAKELRTGRVLRHWRDELRDMDVPPFPIGDDALYVAYLASAELHCHLALDWPLPANILDCYAEFRTLTNGLSVPRGRGLIGALSWFKLDGMAAEEKTEWRDLILSGGPWTSQQQAGILDYCQTDVEALDRLLPRLAHALQARPHWLPHALLRGRYMRSVAAMEYRGIPMDVPTLGRLAEQWDAIKSDLIARICSEYPVFEGTTFKMDRFEALLAQHEVAWPRTETGRLALDEETFRQQVRAHSWLAPIREARDNLAQMRLSSLSVGTDGRNRTLLGVFGSKTGRNLPSNAKFIFGPSAWLRSLIQPKPGMGLAYVDFSSQEVAIAAKLSGDRAMMDGYTSGDPYLAFAIHSAMAPEGATKATHGTVRDQCKAVVLGTQYGMRERTLAQRIGTIPYRGRQLLRAHAEAYPRYWRWVDSLLNYADLNGYIDTVFGWRLHVGADTRPTTLQNFPSQANGAEMLRLACSMAHDAGLRICAPVHDAILLESPLETLERDVEQLREIMTEAGRIVLDGFPVRTDAEIVRAPGRYADKRGEEMWRMVTELLREKEDTRVRVGDIHVP